MKAIVVGEAHLVVDWCVLHVYVVVYFFLSQVIFLFLLLLGMVLYANVLR